MKAIKANIQFLTLEIPRTTRNSELKHKYKKFLIKNPFKIGNFYLAFMADEGHKGQHLVFATYML